MEAGGAARRYAKRRGLSDEDAKEIGQATAVEVYRIQIKNPAKPIANPAAYGKRVAKNKITDHWSTNSVLDELPPEEESMGISASEIDMLSDHNAREAMRFIKGVLTPSQLEVFILRYVDDLTVRQVAEQLDIAEETVKAHLKQAHKRIRDSRHMAQTKLGEP
jgi:RNA polymerase sigma factor (sigma-70 family)